MSILQYITKTSFNFALHNFSLSEPASSRIRKNNVSLYILWIRNICTTSLTLVDMDFLLATLTLTFFYETATSWALYKLTHNNTSQLLIPSLIILSKRALVPI